MKLKYLKLQKSVQNLFFSTTTVPSKCFIPKQEVSERVVNVVVNMGISHAEISNGHFTANLQLDSLKRKELIGKLGEEFCVAIHPSTSSNLMSVESAIDYFSSHPKAR